VLFQAQISGGNPRRQVPTWVVDGDAGTISPRGQFQALRPGIATVRAVVDGVAGYVDVTVVAP
jgi:hypothetical protein